MLSLHNTLTKRKESFTPIKPPQVKLYTCGPTVYDYVHIGNLRSSVTADTLRRVLEYAGFLVRHVKNITDVGHLTADDITQGDSGDDKIAKKAATEGKTPGEIAAFYTAYFERTERSLGILPPHEAPHATDYIPHMIAFIERLIAGGHAYENNGNVFFDVTSFAAYGQLSGNTLDQLRIGARLEKHPDKRHAWDFALWLRAPEGHLMRWPSPWGVGYPGWHIECSAMNLATLGPSIDIHTGGEDNIFPHHEAEIAQSACGNQAPLATYWVHTRHLLVDGQKMSKSKGNFYRLEDILSRGYSAMDLRMLFLGSHYRSQMNFTWDALAQAKANRESITNLYTRLLSAQDALVSGSTDALPLTEVYLALEDDLNTPKALALVLQRVTQINHSLDNKEYDTLSMHDLTYMTGVITLLGLPIESAAIPETVLALAKEREAARMRSDFTRSDALRDKISALGYGVEDGLHGQQLRKK